VGIEFRVLGPLEVTIDGRPIRLHGPKERAVLAVLLLEAGRSVSAERLLEAVWGGQHGSSRSLQVYVSELRRLIGDPRRIAHDGGGYRLIVGRGELDATRFEQLVDAGRQRALVGDSEEAARTLRRALDLWRGEPYAELGGELVALPEVTRLQELHQGATEMWVEAELALGHHARLIPEIEALVAAEPLREVRRRQLMLALYRAGRQADALAAYHASREVLAEELGLDPSAELSRLELEILRHEPRLDVEPVEIRRRRHLPAPVTELVGRRREVSAVIDLLASTARLVTITGAGGIGKTRVALRAAHELAPRFVDGVVFVGLAALRQPGLVPGEIATALGVVDPRDPLTAVADHLANRSTLLVLDNFEQVDEAAPMLAGVLAAGPGISLLVTSRQRLRLYGEHEYPLGPLELDAEAVPLFVRRAMATGHPIGSTPEVRDICARLDRLPLAIELAAARIGELSLADMLAALPRLELARGGARDLPDRQRTLEATIAWSYDLLDPTHRQRLAALSVFAGGCPVDAALEVAGATATELDELVRRSLVVSDGARRSMLETIREFATARLDEAGAGEEVRGRHADWAVRMAEEAEAALQEGRDADLWLDRLEVEHANMRAALDWAAVEEPGVALRLAVALGSFWEFRGHIAEGHGQLARALSAAPGADAGLRARASLRSGVFAHMRGDRDEAATRLDAAFALARSIDDRVVMAKALRNIGTIAKDRGDYRRAMSLNREARRLSAKLGDWLGVSTSLINLADVSLACGDNRRARRYARQSADLARAHGHAMRLVMSLLNLGLAQLRLGKHPDAARAYDTALQLCDRHRYGEGAAYGLIGLAGLAGDLGELRRAAVLLGAADEQLAAAGVVLESTEQPLHDRVREHLRRQLGAIELAAATAEGARLSLAEAVAEGRQLAAALAAQQERERPV
jgi:predicted ATPase/DNA-binding SARP family transcriptional activator